METSLIQKDEKMAKNIIHNLEDFEIDFFEDDSDKEEDKIDTRQGTKDFLPDTVSVTSNSLLRATICELERALKDTRRLLFERDKESTALRLEVEKTRKDLYTEQQARKKLELEKESNAEKFRREENEKSKLREEINEDRKSVV